MFGLGEGLGAVAQGHMSNANVVAFDAEVAENLLEFIGLEFFFGAMDPAAVDP